MLNAYMNALPDHTIPDALVHNNADCSLRHIENAACLSMVVLMRHSQVLRRIRLDIDVLAHFESRQIFRDANSSVVPHWLLVQVPSPGVQTERVGHFF